MRLIKNFINICFLLQKTTLTTEIVPPSGCIKKNIGQNFPCPKLPQVLTFHYFQTIFKVFDFEQEFTNLTTPPP